MPTRVARVITRLNIGGPARHAILLSQSLDARGFETDLIVGSEEAAEGRIEPNEITFTELSALRKPVRPVLDFRAFRQLRSIIQLRRPEIVHTHLAKAGALGRIAARRENVPVVLHTFHGHVLEGYFNRSIESAFIKAERWLATRSDALIAVSSAIRDQLLDLGIGTATQWHVVPVGLDLTDLLTSRVDRNDALRSLGLPTGARYVGIVGRLVPVKNHELFFQIAADIARRFDDVHFLVAGDGSLRPTLERTIPSEIRSRTHFLGWIRDLPLLYAAIDVAVLTSLNEGTPVALIEAGAAQKPVVASDVGGVSDVVLDGKTGLLFEVLNKDEAVAKVEKLLRDAGLSQMLASAARAHVRERFASRRLTDDICELYTDLLRRKGLR